MNARMPAGATEKLDATIGALEAAIRLDPRNGPAWCRLGMALRAIGQLQPAIMAYQRAIELMPGSGEIYVNLGVALDCAERRDEAVAAYRRAIELAPGLPEGHFNLANALCAMDKVEEGIAAFREAIARRKNFVAAHCNLGNALASVGRHDEAMDAYDRAVEIDPQSANSHWNRSLALLLRGDYEQGWPEYEWRHQLSASNRAEFSRPRWLGGNLDGRTILLHGEHGLGDTVQFVRYAPMVAARGGRVILRCQRELGELFKGMDGVDQLVIEDESIPPFDVHCPLMSLPAVFGTRLDSIPRPPCFKADPGRADRWRAMMGTCRNVLRVGLVWAGSALHQFDRQRSMALSTLAPLGRVPGARFYSLQKGAAAEQLGNPSAGPALVDHTELLNDFAETAALIAQLDLVISVDTAVAHVAAALGKPVWLLLALAPDWRWMLDRTDSPWYPSVRLFRQRVHGDWGPVIEEAAQKLDIFCRPGNNIAHSGN